MQRAARKVAQENERLRTLLARHGVLRDEIDSFLRMCEQTEGSAEAETVGSNAKSPNVLSPYINHPGPRSLHIQPLSPAYPKEYSPRPSPVQIARQTVQIPRQPTQLSRQPVQGGCSTSKRGSPTKPATDVQVEAAIVSKPVEACSKAESYYASPSETDSSPPPRRPQECYPVTSPNCQPSTQSQGCCPPSKPQPEVVMEDPDCPSTADCFCPPVTPASTAATSIPPMRSDEISCETAATIIAQMRGDGDDAAARASLGCNAGEICNIKNSFLMQIMDER